VQDVNSLVTSGPQWQLTATDVMAIMGSHSIMMTLACTTGGTQVEGLAIDDRTCGGSGGRQRMFTWDNSFYQVQFPQTPQTQYMVFCQSFFP
jgi:hypothetical protein